MQKQEQSCQLSDLLSAFTLDNSENPENLSSRIPLPLPNIEENDAQDAPETPPPTGNLYLPIVEENVQDNEPISLNIITERMNNMTRSLGITIREFTVQDIKITEDQPGEEMSIQNLKIVDSDEVFFFLQILIIIRKGLIILHITETIV